MTDRVFIIAEAGVNHDGVLDDALAMIDVAAQAGADAVKFQTFTAETLLTTRAMKADYQVANTGEAGAQMDMIRRLELSRADHDALYQRCQARGVAFMSTAFDLDSLRFLARYDMPAIKIPSGDITWGPMLLEAARMGRPLLVSTGMATMDEIRDALAVIAFALTREGDPARLGDTRAALDSQTGQAAIRRVVTLLHCTTQYPAPFDAVNLRAMATMFQAFGVPVGYSDHTLGLAVPIAAVAMGARVIEKHFTLDRARAGPDHAASLTPDELAAMVCAIRETEVALGSAEKAPSASEVPNRLVARRSLVAMRSIAAGETICAAALTSKRPADGLSPMKAWEVTGCRAKQAYAPDDAIAPETTA